MGCDKTIFTAFRCPTKLYNELLKNSENKSEIIVSALASYQSKDFRDNLLKGYIQLNKLFKQISRHFAPEFKRTELALNELVYYINDNITNSDVIDSINEILGD